MKCVTHSVRKKIEESSDHNHICQTLLNSEEKQRYTCDFALSAEITHLDLI